MDCEDDSATTLADTNDARDDDKSDADVVTHPDNEQMDSSDGSGV
jgi:hypothetical protein